MIKIPHRRANLTIEYIIVSLFIISISIASAKKLNKIFKNNIEKLEKKLSFEDWDLEEMNLQPDQDEFE